MVGSTLLMMIGTLLSKGLGLLREITLADTYGAGADMDAFLGAMNASVICVLGIAAGLQASVVPVFSGLLEQYGQREAHRRFAATLNAVVIFLVGVTITIELLAPLLVRAAMPGFRGQQYQLTLTLVRWNTPLVFLTGLLSVGTGLLTALRSFTVPALSGIPFNAVYIGILWMTALNGGTVYSVASAAIAATATQVVFVYVALYRSGLRIRWSIDLRNPLVVRVGQLMLPVFFGSLASQMNVLIDGAVASGLGAGNVSALSYAARIKDLPHTIVTASVLAVAYPNLARRVAVGDTAGYEKALQDGIRLLIALCLPISLFMLTFSLPLTAAFYKRGAFDDLALSRTAFALACYGTGILSLAIKEILEKSFYAISNTRVPTLIALLSLVFNAFLDILFGRMIGVAGLALATSVAATLNCGILYAIYKKHNRRDLISRDLVFSTVKVLLSSLFALSLSYMLYLFVKDMVSAVAVVSLVGVTFAFSYVLLAYSLKEAMVRELLGRFTHKLRHLTGGA